MEPRQKVGGTITQVHKRVNFYLHIWLENKIALMIYFVAKFKQRR